MTEERTAPTVVESDVIVVGAGPGGSATAKWLADRGLNVSLLEKSAFPRDKVCGDGLTPRATKQLIRLGVDVSTDAGWVHNIGLRTYAGRTEPFEFLWPELASFPNYGLTRKRGDFDEMLARLAVKAGATLYEETNASEPILDAASDRIVGVRAKDGREFRAPIVVAADGNSSRIALAMGLEKNKLRPMGVAARAYFRSPSADSDFIESCLELWDGEPGASNLLPGYAWMFPLGDGLINVGLGTVNSTATSQKMNGRKQLQTWLHGSTPRQWGLSPENQVGEIGSAALPMSFNRKPAYTRGLVLVGDSAGMVSPFNGEGIPYAMEAAEMAADAIADAHGRGFGSRAAEMALTGYRSRLEAEWGGYYRLGQVFVALIERPEVMRLCTRYGLPRPTLMKFTMKLLAHLYDTTDGDWMDKTITAMTKVVPSA